MVGPDLSSVGNRKDRTWLLQSILEPSRQMAPEYLPRTIVLNDGRTFTGIRLRSYTHETIRDTHGQNLTFNRDDIESMVESTVSFMPAGIVNSLTIRELRDLMAFLENRNTSVAVSQTPQAGDSSPVSLSNVRVQSRLIVKMGGRGSCRADDRGKLTARQEPRPPENQPSMCYHRNPRLHPNVLRQ